MSFLIGEREPHLLPLTITDKYDIIRIRKEMEKVKI